MMEMRGYPKRVGTTAAARDLAAAEGISLHDIGGDPAVLMKFAVEHPKLITLNLRDIRANSKQLKIIFTGCYNAAKYFCPGHVPASRSSRLSRADRSNRLDRLDRVDCSNHSNHSNQLE